MGEAPSGVPASSAALTASDSRLLEAREAEYQKALASVEAALQEAAEPGAPSFEAQRVQLVARAKSEPVLFRRNPAPAKCSKLEICVERDRLLKARPAWRALERVREKFEAREAALREILLREGYLYSEIPDLAFALVSQVRPRELFSDSEIWVQRGERTWHAKLEARSNSYRYMDGPEVGKPVKLLHLDRVGSGSVPPPPLHLDLRALRYRIFFDEIRVKHISERSLVADVRYGQVWVKSVFELQGPTLVRRAEAVEAKDVERVTLAKQQRESATRRMLQLQRTMLAQIEEALPFDEPKTELGQEDGALRRAWTKAYRETAVTYEYNGDEYKVFDKRGRPRVPQVCIDYIIDTFERASGSWWLPKSAEVRERSAGGFRFSSLLEGNLSLRQTSTFIHLAKDHPEMFEVTHIPERAQIELGHKARLFRWLEKHAEDFEVGDIVLIRGLTPWDDVHEHTHAFFVYEVDPISRVPIAIAGNAGPANLWSWETEARRTPHRTIRTRIRPRLSWLQTVIPPAEDLEPPALLSSTP